MGLGDSIVGTIKDNFGAILQKVFHWFQPKLVGEIKAKVVFDLFNEDWFEDGPIKDAITQLKEDWKKSPDTLGDIAHGLVSVVKGQLTEAQLGNIIDSPLAEGETYESRLFAEMGIITQATIVSNILGIAGEVLSLGQLDGLGREIRAYLDYSGLSQITGFGYGMLLSSALTPLIQKEIYAKTTPSVWEPQTATLMRFRGLITDEDYYQNMKYLGYNEKPQDLLHKSSWYYPQPTDFVRFGLRETFREDIVKAYGYDEDNPLYKPGKHPKDLLWPDWLPEPGDNKMEELIRYGGLDPAVFQWYWRAHWDLPSVTQGYEMLHRQVIDLEQLNTLLKTLDIAPGWRDRLIAISYSPFTRVDSRRMYETGVLDDNAYTKALTDVGYSPENAELLLAWTKVRKMGAEKDLTKAQIIRAFRDGLKGRLWTLTALQGMGYDEDESELIVLLTEHDIHTDEQQEIIDHLVRVRTQDKITDDELEKELDTLGLVEIHKGKVMARIERERKARTRLPTKADLESWVKKGLITDEVFTDRMKSLGFLEPDIKIYLLEMKPTVEGEK